MFGLMRHPAQAKFRLGIEALPIKSVKQSGGSASVKTAVVKTESNCGHISNLIPAAAKIGPPKGTKPLKMDGSQKNVKRKPMGQALTFPAFRHLRHDIGVPLPVHLI
jgi:hypothetical protein